MDRIPVVGRVVDTLNLAVGKAYLGGGDASRVQETLGKIPVIGELAQRAAENPAGTARLVQFGWNAVRAAGVTVAAAKGIAVHTGGSPGAIDTIAAHSPQPNAPAAHADVMPDTVTAHPGSRSGSAGMDLLHDHDTPKSSAIAVKAGPAHTEALVAAPETPTAGGSGAAEAVANQAEAPKPHGFFQKPGEAVTLTLEEKWGGSAPGGTEHIGGMDLYKGTGYHELAKALADAGVPDDKIAASLKDGSFHKFVDQMLVDSGHFKEVKQPDGSIIRVGDWDAAEHLSQGQQFNISDQTMAGLHERFGDFTVEQAPAAPAPAAPAPNPAPVAPAPAPAAPAPAPAPANPGGHGGEAGPDTTTSTTTTTKSPNTATTTTTTNPNTTTTTLAETTTATTKPGTTTTTRGSAGSTLAETTTTTTRPKTTTSAVEAVTSTTAKQPGTTRPNPGTTPSSAVGTVPHGTTPGTYRGGGGTMPREFVEGSVAPGTTPGTTEPLAPAMEEASANRTPIVLGVVALALFGAIATTVAINRLAGPDDDDADGTSGGPRPPRPRTTPPPTVAGRRPGTPPPSTPAPPPPA